MKTYVLIVSQQFPKTHPKAGSPTHFIASILNGSKLHTIRSNYSLWEKRIYEIRQGLAVLSIRIWEGKPYNSKQKEILQLDSKSGIGIQRLEKHFHGLYCGKTDFNFQKNFHINCSELSKNDGLDENDFYDWFDNWIANPNCEPMAIIHFTNFRYEE